LNNKRERLIGVGLVVLSAAAWSLNGLYTRFLTVDVWTTLVGRGIAAIVMIGAVLAVVHRRDAARLIAFNVRHGAIVILCGAASMIAFVAALFNTSVANVTVIYFVSPLIAAILARFFLGDRLVARTAVAFVISLAGVTIMVGASLGTEQLAGDVLALVMSATFAVVIVEMRRKPLIDNLTATLLMSAVTVLVISPFASLSTVTFTDAVVLALFSFTSNILGFFLFISGVRRLPPAEAGLIATIEILLAPFWVWLFFAERPGQATILGGMIVVAAVVFQLFGEIRRRPAEAEEVETTAKVL
jgi:drug/metabolite transporter (DMT)-like permease